MAERDLVDQALRSAKEGLNAQALNPSDAARLTVLVYCTEAIVRQIRDADDTVATVLTPRIETALEDMTIAIGGISVERHDRKSGGFF